MAVDESQTPQKPRAGETKNGASGASGASGRASGTVPEVSQEVRSPQKTPEDREALILLSRARARGASEGSGAINP